MAVRQIIVRRNSFLAPLRKWAYNASGFNKYGLMHDDCLYEDEDVKEALRRLPENILHERNFRIVRAVQLSIQHDYLPKEQWTKYEEDVKYLSPIIEQVKKEKAEQEEWDASH
uniref:Cytochrome b-c1 complex subunit 7 n=1 Tax=Riptortus pedestris TaxID=329032 RepID=R4WPG7_RIPPE|nr:ubiquinol-cytochrome c reductase complex 14 kd protein [Riptortus pedestris]